MRIGKHSRAGALGATIGLRISMFLAGALEAIAILRVSMFLIGFRVNGQMNGKGAPTKLYTPIKL